MLPCFGFETSNHIENMRKYLETTLDCTISKSSYLGAQVLFVPEEEYSEAINIGYDFITANKVKNVVLFDFYQMVKPVEEVPLFYAGILSKYTDEDGTWNEKTEEALNKIKNELQTLVGKDIYYRGHLRKNTFFYILRNDIKESEHEETLKKIANYLKSCEILINVNLTTFYGKRFCLQ